MENILVYGDSLTWGIIPDTRRRLPFEQRWPGILEAQLSAAGLRCRGMAEAYRKVASDEGCSFFDAGSVTGSSVVDGVHLDADQHERLGKALVPEVARLLPT